MIFVPLIAAAVLGLWLLYTAGPHTMRRRLRRPTVMHRTASTAPAAPRSAVRLLCGALVGAAGWIGTWTLFGGMAAPALVAAIGGAVPPSSARRRRRRLAGDCWQAWPRLLAEIRISVAQRGQSIPAALFAVGAHAPAHMRPAFGEAERSWSLNTDFEAALRVLKTSLADPTADAVCETLLAAYQIGGVRIEARLRALAEAAQAEAAARADARAKQAGARFARSFVAAVPAFMAVIGLSIGRGRQAYESGGGQVLVALSVAAVAGCWLWAGRMMAIPARKRVFLQ
ncbi:hypothetical protein [Candidatus Poriferisodalis sp.]|uniref:hypothetical protein n=1 Tax=Candidatus Poriferisodalis sp. TaxID=3101277 RepID=UPI003B02DB3F